MTSDLNPQLITSRQSYVLYDPELVSQPHAQLFDADWLQAHGQLESVTGGRGDAWLVDYDSQHWVLRCYLRGGMVARVIRHTYLGWRLSATRAWQEWHLLHTLWRKNLPVARPVAASLSWPYGRVFGLYRASIIVERITGARTLAQHIQQQVLADDVWQKVGECIALFHRHNVYHADLNANNILLDADDKVYLIDFDRGAIKPDGRWKQANLQRLLRSLLKLQQRYPQFHFNLQNWHDLVAAYETRSSA